MRFNKYIFSDLVEKWIDNRGKTPPLSETGIPLLEVKHLPERGIYPSFDGTKFVTQETYASWFRAYLEPMDILFSTVGTTARVTLTPETPVVAIAQNVLGIRFKSDLADPLYMFYYMRAKQFQHDIEARLVTTVQASIKRADMVGIPITLPEVSVQRRIAKKIISFDKKIELNRQTNQTLEQIAQAIFKSWFVDFEPTRAKIAAKQIAQARQDSERSAALRAALFADSRWPEAVVTAIAEGDPERAAMAAISGKSLDELDQLSPEQQTQLLTTASLFPDALVDSELGEVPEGWAVGTLNDLCSLNEKSWTKKNSPDEVWYVDLANTKNGVIEDVQHYIWAEAPSRAKRILSDGDTIVGTVRPGNRSFSFVGEMGKQLTASTGFAVLNPKKPKYREFVFIAATGDENIDRLAHLADGGAYPAVRPDVVTAMELVIPADAVMAAFNRVSKALFDVRDMNLSSDNTFEKLRDTLLPKLLSGELKASPNQTKFDKTA